MTEDRKIEYDTLAKEAIKLQTKKETLSEEERVLYVALTRSKEKLIITGLSKDVQKDLDDKKMQLQIYSNESENINSSLIAKGKSYLDWIEYVYLKNKENTEEYITLNVIKKESILEKDKEAEKVEDKNEKIQDKLSKIKSTKEIDEIKKIIEWKYENYLATTIPSKASVTKLKELENEEQLKVLFTTEEQSESKKNTNSLAKFRKKLVLLK